MPCSQSLIDGLAEAAADGRAKLEARLHDRVHELAADVSVDRATLAAEIVRTAARSDISEEVTRFQAHLVHWDTLSDSPEPCGRKLDFLLQEMNREINTIGSKADGDRRVGADRDCESRAREAAGAGPECRVR